MDSKRYDFIKAVKRILSVALIWLPLLFWVAIVFAFDTPYMANLTLICVAIHELGHIITAGIISKKRLLRSRFFGLKLTVGSYRSYSEDLKISLAGPLANIIAALITLPFIKTNSHYIHLFSVVNLCTAVSNLLPIDGYDGYRIAEDILNLVCNSPKTPIFLKYVSLVIAVALCFFALYLMVKVDGGYWIYLVFVVSAVSSIKKCSHCF